MYFSYAARQILSAAVLPYQGKHAACRHTGNEKGVPQAAQPGAGADSAVESEGRGHHNGVSAAGCRGARQCAVHGRRVSDGNSGNRGHRLHNQGVLELCHAHSDDGGAAEQREGH